MKNMAKGLAIALAVTGLVSGAALAVSQNDSIDRIEAAALGNTQTIAAQVAAPEKYTATAENANGTMTMAADVEIILPDAEYATVLRVEQDVITQAQVDILYGLLVKGGQLYDAEAYVPSKAMYQQRIDALEAMKKGLGDDPILQFKQMTPESIDATIEWMRTEMEAAGEEEALVPIDPVLTDFTRAYRYEADGVTEVPYSGSELHGLAHSEAGGYELFYVFNSDAETNFVIYAAEPDAYVQNTGAYTAITDDMDISAATPLSITQAQAEDIAKALQAALGTDSLDLARAEKVVGGDSAGGYYGTTNPKRQAWELIYTRTVNGMPTTYSDFDCMKVEDDDQNSPVSYERMTFIIDDGGIVAFQWSAPYAITGTVTESAKLISLEECADVFETLVFPVNKWMAENGGADIQVTAARLGMSRVTSYDERSAGVLVPVWDFFGDVTMRYEQSGQASEMLLEDWNLLTVNAVTGEVINRNLGY